MSTKKTAFGVMILAAGLGKRMHSPLSKVVHEIHGQPMLFHVLDRLMECAPHVPIAIVVGHGREHVESLVRSAPKFSSLNLTFIYQPEPRGTGHAARCAMEAAWGDALSKQKKNILILPGDLPLLTSEIILNMTDPLPRSTAARMLTCTLPEPSGYGRVIRRGKSGPVLKIIEERDANNREKQVQEVATSIYLFDSDFLRTRLRTLTNKNAQKEYYLPDVIAQATQARKKVEAVHWANFEEVKGVNNPWELAEADDLLNLRRIQNLALSGVRFINPSQTRVDCDVEVEAGVTIHPGVCLQGKTRIAANTVIGPSVQLKNVEVGQDCRIKAGTVAEDSVIGSGAQVGPYAHLRPESVVGTGCKIGNFVELKKSRIGAKTNIAHLSYVGDAIIGERVNIGCGFVTCNFDGRIIDGKRKHETVIEDDVFMGSDCQVIAPIRIGKGAYIASGSTINGNVDPDALAIARSRQVNKPGYASRLRPPQSRTEI